MRQPIDVAEVFAGISWGAVAFAVTLCAIDMLHDMLIYIVEARPLPWLRGFWRPFY